MPEENVFYGPRPGEEDFKEYGNISEQYSKLAKRLLLSANRVTAVFCSNDDLGERVFYTALQLGIKVPDELSIISLSFCDVHDSGAMREQLTRVSYGESELSMRLIEVLYEMREGKRSLNDDERILMPLHLDKRKTLGQARREKNGVRVTCQ